MNKIIAFFKKLRLKIARIIVIAWAKLNYRIAVDKANKRYEEERTMIYVVAQPFQPDVLTTYDHRRFKAEKAAWGRQYAAFLTLAGMKAGCYYHTPDRAGNQAMTPEEIEKRKAYFIRERLYKAKLL